MSLTIRDHTVLLAIQQKWTHPHNAMQFSCFVTYFNWDIFHHKNGFVSWNIFSVNWFLPTELKQKHNSFDFVMRITQAADRTQTSQGESHIVDKLLFATRNLETNWIRQTPKNKTQSLCDPTLINYYMMLMSASQWSTQTDNKQSQDTNFNDANIMHVLQTRQMRVI